jgi:hypothetical protein
MMMFLAMDFHTSSFGCRSHYRASIVVILRDNKDGWVEPFGLHGSEKRGEISVEEKEEAWGGVIGEVGKEGSHVRAWVFLSLYMLIFIK